MAALSKDLSALGTQLFARNNFQMALIGEEEALPQARTSAATIFEQLPMADPMDSARPISA